MNRRDFLRLRVRGEERVLEVSCEQLYMTYLDARSMTGALSHGEDDDPVEGEPPTQFDFWSGDEVLLELERRAVDATVLRVCGPEWLGNGPLRERVEWAIESVRSRGQRVEMSVSAAERA